MVEKFEDEDAKNGNFNNQMDFCKKSIIRNVHIVTEKLVRVRLAPMPLPSSSSSEETTGLKDGVFQNKDWAEHEVRSSAKPDLWVTY